MSSPIPEYVLVEKETGFPVGSVVSWKKKSVYNRDITYKHIFSKGNYKAIAIDNPVALYFENNASVTEALFRLKGENKAYITPIQNYISAKPKKMGGRLQRFVSLDRFQEYPIDQPLPRPADKKFINDKGEEEKC